MKVFLNFILLIAFLHVSTASFSQKKKFKSARFELGKSQTREKGISVHPLGFDGEVFYTLGTHGSLMIGGEIIGFRYVVYRWNEKMKFLSEHELPNKTKDFKFKYTTKSQFFMLDDRIVQVMAPIKKKAGKEIYVIEYGLETLKVLRTQKVGSIEEIDLKSFKKSLKGQDEFFRMSFIEDENGKGFFGYQYIQQRDVNKCEVKLAVFNPKCELVYEEKEMVNKNLPDFKMLDYKIHDGYLSYLELDEIDDDKAGKASFKLINLNTSEKQEVQLDNEKIPGDISQVNYGFDQNNDLIIVGKNNGADEGANNFGGLFTQKYNLNSGELRSEDTYQFTYEDLVRYSIPAAKEKIDKMIQKGDQLKYNYRILETKVEENGSAFVLGERYHAVISSHYSEISKTVVETHYHYHNELVGMKIDSVGNIEWVNTIERSDKFKGYDYGGVVTHQTNDGLEVLYYNNDDLKMAYFDKNVNEMDTKVIYSKSVLGDFQLNLDYPLSFKNEVFFFANHRGNFKVLKIKHRN